MFGKVRTVSILLDEQKRNINIHVALDKMLFFSPKVLIFFLFLHETYIVGNH